MTSYIIGELVLIFSSLLDELFIILANMPTYIYWGFIFMGVILIFGLIGLVTSFLGIKS